MSHLNWEADKMLDVYIYDYLKKRQLHASARIFQAEGSVSMDPVVIDAPNGFLFEWWSVFWDIYIARTNQKHSEAAASYSKSQQSKAREMQRQLEQELLNANPNQQMHMQLLLQKYAQQQQSMGGTQLVSGSDSCPISNDPLMRQNQATLNAMATKTYEDRLKLPLQQDALDGATIKQKVADNVGQHLDPNHGSLLKAVAATTGRQATGQKLLSVPSILLGNNQQVQNRNQKLPVSTQDIKSDMNAMPRSQAVVPEGSSIGCHGSNQGGSNLTLKGWPLAGLDQLRSGFLQQNNLMQSLQSFNQLSLRQQLMLQAQQNLVSPSAGDFESRRLRMLLNCQNTGLGKDGQSNSVGDLMPNNGTPAQVGSPVLPRPDSVMFPKQQVQKSSQQVQQYSQHPLSSQQSQSLQRQEKISPGSMTVDGNVSSTLQGNDQASKSQIGRKRKPASSSGPANSSGTANTIGPSANSPSTPSTQTPGDMMIMSTLQQNVPSSKSSLMFGTDGLSSHTSAQNQLADMDQLAGDGSMGDNVESFLLLDDTDPTEKVGKGFSFKEIKHIMASSHKVECCHFSSDGKLLATGGHDNKASLWCTELFNLKSTLQEHSEWITDVRFCPSLLRVATSSADKTVKVWDVDNPSYSIRTFTGHATSVLSLDFHPDKDDLICSCDNGEIRYWSIKNGSCTGVFKGGATQMRFQPCMGRLLAAAVDNLVSIFDVETLGCKLQLQGHNDPVKSVCWDLSGKYMASLSGDLVRVWTVGSGGKGEWLHELNASENKFNTCAFHPFYPVLVIGCRETLQLWDFSENKTLTLNAHDKVVSSLAVSNVTGLLASTSHDKHFKIWK
ncbi:transcriptional corepressor LEUNIG-like isoform X2 [Abrus precatorius]|uniref:Transcriptional corepressor LEUNIG-like isoform X2 n=2 Tax=Abrus precatorius TaxID=3816 RepID=A0A8B8JFB3_ABRPR|nr:transcriptional corepressor LEUNIG-like isoform X2 [Abrus precatorius]